MSLLLGTNGLGKIAIQGHVPVLDELAVTQFNSSDSKSRKLFTYVLPGPVLSINLPCQLNYAVSPQRIWHRSEPDSLLGLHVAEWTDLLNEIH